MEIYDLAIIEFQQYIDKIEDDPISYRLLGDCYANLKQFEQSIINYRKALELYDYEDVKTIYSLGLSYFEISDNINAAKYFKSILKLTTIFQSSSYASQNILILVDLERLKKNATFFLCLILLYIIH